MNITEEDVHEVSAHLLCNLGDQEALLTNQDPLQWWQEAQGSALASQMGEGTQLTLLLPLSEPPSLTT